MADPNDRVRDRAYEIWDKAGRPPDRDVENWLQAEREVGTDAVDGPVEGREMAAGPDETCETISDHPKSSIETLTQPAPDSVEQDG
jgi:hypothetical protein